MFEASHGPPYETNEVLTQALAEAFILETTPSPEDFEVSLTNLVNFKDGTTLTNRSFISATKSLISQRMHVLEENLTMLKVCPTFFTIQFFQKLRYGEVQ